MKPVLYIALALTSVGTAQATKKLPVQNDGQRLLQVFDVKDLVHIPEDRFSGQDARAMQARVLKSLVGFVRSFVDPKLSPEDDIKALGRNRIAVLVTPRQQAWLERFFALNRKFAQQPFDITARILKVPPATYEKHLQPILKLGNAAPGKAAPSRHAILASAKQAGTLLTTLNKTKGIEHVSAPRLLVNPMQQVSLTVAKEIAYVRKFELRKISHPKMTVVDPVIETIHDGIRFEGTAASLTKDKIGMSFKLVVTHVLQPIKYVNEPPKNLPAKIKNQKFMVADVNWDRYTLSTKAELPNGGAGLFSLGKRHGKYLLLMISVSRVGAPK